MGKMRHSIALVCAILITGAIFSTPMEQNALTQGLVKIFPTLAEKDRPYIDFDRSGDRRTEPGVPEVVWDRPGSGHGLIQAQEILDMVVYKNTYKYLTLDQLNQVNDLLTAIGKTTGGGESEIMTRKVARSFKSELEALIQLRKQLPDRVTKNEKEKVYADLRQAMQRMYQQFSKEADKEAMSTFKADMEKFTASVEVMKRAEKDSPMEFPFAAIDDAKGSAHKVMVRIVADELLHAKEKNIRNDLAIFSLGKMKGRSAMQTLQTALQNPAFAKNIDDTIAALGMIGEEASAEIVNIISQQLATSVDPKTRLTAINTLGKVGSAKAATVLKQYATNPPAGYANLQVDAIRALVNIAENERKRGKSAKDLAKIFQDFDQNDSIDEAVQSAKGMALINNQVPYAQVNALLQKMKDNPNPELVGEIVAIFNLVEKYNPGSHRKLLSGGSNVKDILKYLQECLTGDKQRFFKDHQNTRLEIARLLKDIIAHAPMLAALPEFVSVLTDESAELKQESAKLLVDASREIKVGQKSKSPNGTLPYVMFQAILKQKEKKGILRDGLKIIGKQKLPHPGVIDTLFEHLSDLDDQVVRQAIRALAAQINPQTVSNSLYRAKELENVRALIVKSTAPVDIRVTAIEVAGKIGFSDAGSSGNNILKALVEISGDRKADEELKVAAFRAFSRIREKQERENKLWEKMRDQLVEYVSVGTLMERKAAAQALGEINEDTKEVRAALHAALGNKDNALIYIDLIEALGRINNDESTEHILNLISSDQKIDVPTRQMAIRVLGNLGDPEAADALLDALSDAQIAETAERGLVQYEPGLLTRRIKERLEKETNDDVKRRLQRLLKA